MTCISQVDRLAVIESRSSSSESSPPDRSARAATDEDRERAAAVQGTVLDPRWLAAVS
jgi:hypothetical protein